MTNQPEEQGISNRGVFLLAALALFTVFGVVQHTQNQADADVDRAVEMLVNGR